MPTFSQTPGELDIQAVVGTDFALSLDFTNTISGFTFEAGIILNEFPSETIFPFTSSIFGTNRKFNAYGCGDISNWRYLKQEVVSEKNEGQYYSNGIVWKI